MCDAAAAAAAFPSRENLNRRRLRNGGARPSYRVSRPKSMVTWTSGGTGGLRAYLLPPYMYGTARGGGWGAVCRRHCGPDGRREGASLTGVQQNGCSACVRVWMSVLVQNALALREQPVDDVPVRLCNGKGQARARDVGRENCAFYPAPAGALRLTAAPARRPQALEPCVTGGAENKTKRTTERFFSNSLRTRASCAGVPNVTRTPRVSKGAGPAPQQAGLVPPRSLRQARA